MSNVYLLYHNGPDFETTGDTDQSKLLGVFSSEAAARAWQERASALPGFRDEPDGFLIDTYELDKQEWTTGFIRMDGASGSDPSIT
jgi:hypothetical protein